MTRSADNLAVELESAEVVVGCPVRGRVVGHAGQTEVILRAEELRGSTFHRQDEDRAAVDVDGSFELSGPLQPSFFGEEFSIQWMVVARTPTREVQHPVHVVAPMTTRDFSVGKPLSADEVAGWMLVAIGLMFCVYVPFVWLEGELMLLLILLAHSGVVTLWGLRVLWRFRTFGRVDFDVTSHPGRYRIEFRVRREVQLQRVFIRLCCFEQVPGRKRNFVPKRFRKLPPASDRILEMEIDALDEPRDVYVGNDIHFEGTFALPDDAPFTLRRFGSPSISWQAELWTKHDDSETFLGSHSLKVQAPKLLEQDEDGSDRALPQAPR